MNTALGLGFCAKCRQAKIEVEGMPQCLSCDAKPSAPVGPTINVADPGEDKIRMLVGGGSISIPKKAGASTPIVQSRTLDACIKDALAVLMSAPMPSDIKQFKNIQKAVKILKEIAEQSHD